MCEWLENHLVNRYPLTMEIRVYFEIESASYGEHRTSSQGCHT